MSESDANCAVVAGSRKRGAPASVVARMADAELPQRRCGASEPGLLAARGSTSSATDAKNPRSGPFIGAGIPARELALKPRRGAARLSPSIGSNVRQVEVACRDAATGQGRRAHRRAGARAHERSCCRTSRVALPTFAQLANPGTHPEHDQTAAVERRARTMRTHSISFRVHWFNDASQDRSRRRSRARRPAARADRRRRARSSSPSATASP